METQTNKWGLLDWIILLVALTPSIAAFLVYDRLPEQMVAHYDENFQPDRYQDNLSLLLTSSLVSLLPVLLKYSSRLDPMKQNYQKFGRAYTIFRLGTALLLSGAYGMLLLDGLGYNELFNMRLVVFIGLGLFLMVMGNYFGQIRFNYFFGIRSPWTLANEDVWRKTHRLAGPLWMIGGLIFLIAAFLPEGSVPWMVGVSVVILAVIPYGVSYFYYRKLS